MNELEFLTLRGRGLRKALAAAVCHTRQGRVKSEVRQKNLA